MACVLIIVVSACPVFPSRGAKRRHSFCLWRILGHNSDLVPSSSLVCHFMSQQAYITNVPKCSITSVGWIAIDYSQEGGTGFPSGPSTRARPSGPRRLCTASAADSAPTAILFTGTAAVGTANAVEQQRCRYQQQPQCSSQCLSWLRVSKRRQLQPPQSVAAPEIQRTAASSVQPAGSSIRWVSERG